MLNIIIHPYDIIDYLSLRHKWLLGANGLPTFAIGDSKNKVDGHYTHTVEIIYNLVGAIDLPDFGDLLDEEN